MKNNIIIQLTALLLALYSINSIADVFKTVDSHGKLVYSSRKSDQNTSSIELKLPKSVTTTSNKP